MTKLLLLEVEHLMEEVSSFVQSCCNSQCFDEEQISQEVNILLTLRNFLKKIINTSLLIIHVAINFTNFFKNCRSMLLTLVNDYLKESYVFLARLMLSEEVVPVHPKSPKFESTT